MVCEITYDLNEANGEDYDAVYDKFDTAFPENFIHVQESVWLVGSHNPLMTPDLIEMKLYNVLSNKDSLLVAQINPANYAQRNLPEVAEFLDRY